MDHMTWETPPPSGHGYDWSEVATMLRARPNQWLKVFDDGPVSIINAIRQEKIAALTPNVSGRDSGFEVRTRNNTQTSPRTATLYLRWVQEGGE